MRFAHIASSVALLATIVLSGCGGQNEAALAATNNLGASGYLTVPSGTSLDVTLGTGLSSETATVGDAWSGSVRSATMVGGKDLVPAGSTVSGTVSAVTPARKGDRAMLDLALSSITVDGHRYGVTGTTEAVIAGSTRARNLGAIAGSAAAGALIGKAVGGDAKDAVIGGVVGGAVATGVVAGSQGWQVELKTGTAIAFTTSEAVAVRP